MHVTTFPRPADIQLSKQRSIKFATVTGGPLRKETFSSIAPVVKPANIVKLLTAGRRYRNVMYQ